MAASVWGNVNTFLEIGFELLRLMEAGGKRKAAEKDTEVEKITDGVLLMSNDKDVLIAVNKSIASKTLSDTAVSDLYCEEKNGFYIYSGAAAAIPMYELSKGNDAVRGYIVSDESLRATLCGNYPEYVKAHNMAAPPGEQIEDADAPPCLFLQKHLDNAADETQAAVTAIQHAQADKVETEKDVFADVLELDR